ncbi:MAG: hypothetical protein KJO91_00620 [Gammaproteobacteria bacterium]|nr:hypothetical protein [Gammaproteobacteria bacterium]
MKKLILLTIFVLSCATQVLANTPAQTGLIYLNSLRSAAGMTTLSSNANLDTAALNHSTYNQINNFIGHYESLDFPTGFKGVTPADRVVAAGYLSTTVSENVSYDSDGDGESDKDEIDSGTDLLNPPRSGAWKIILPLILNQN